MALTLTCYYTCFYTYTVLPLGLLHVHTYNNTWYCTLYTQGNSWKRVFKALPIACFKHVGMYIHVHL